MTSGSWDNTFNFGVFASVLDQGIDFSIGSDYFVCKFSADGRQLQGSTFMGGSGNDGLHYENSPLCRNYGDELRGDITLDNQGNIYVAGTTYSIDFPTTSQALQPVFGGGGDACIFKFNSNLTSLLYSTYLGGSSQEVALSLRAKPDGRVVVAGGTMSGNFPATTAASDNTYGGNGDGFISQISTVQGINNGQTTFLGQGSYDQIYFLQLDQNDDVFVLGQTFDNAWPTSNNVYQVAGGGLFVVKMNADLTNELITTSVGKAGNPSLSPTAFLVDSCDRIYISGWGGQNNDSDRGNGRTTNFIGGSTTGLPVTTDALQKTTDGSDFYFMVLDPGAAALRYGSYYGGRNAQLFSSEHVDGGTSRFSKEGVIYQAVCAGCNGTSSFPTTPGVWSETNESDNCNMAAIKINLNELEALFSPSQREGCAPLTISFDNTGQGGTSFLWDFGDGTTTTLGSKVAATHTYTEPGSYPVVLRASDPATCIKNDFYQDTIVVKGVPRATDTSTTFCPGNEIQFTHLPDSAIYTYKWRPATYLSSDTVAHPVIRADQSVSYLLIITDTATNCQADVRIELAAQPLVLDFYTLLTYEGCQDPEPDVLLINNTGGNGTSTVFDGLGNQFVRDNSNRRADTIAFAYTQPGDYTLFVNAQEGVCADSLTETISIQPLRISNVITPNGDNKNDYFVVSPPLPGWQLELYNRWGKPLFDTKDYDQSWQAEGLPAGTYFYMLTSPDGFKCRSWVQVLR